MAPPAPRRTRLLLAAAALLLLAGGGVWVMTRGPAYEKRGSLHCLVDGDELYTFDAAFRKETLRRRDPRTGLRTVVVESPPPARMAALREALLRELRLPALEAIPPERQREVDAAHELGYF